MCCFVFVSPLSNVIWGYSKAAASVTWVNRRKFLKMTAAKLFLRKFRECGHTSFTIFFFAKITRLDSHLFWYFWNFAWILGTKILKYRSSFRANVWLHASSITSILQHIILKNVLLPSRFVISVFLTKCLSKCPSSTKRPHWYISERALVCESRALKCQYATNALL